MTTRAPTQNESDRWEAFVTHANRALKEANGCMILGDTASRLRVYLESIGVTGVPWPADNNDIAVLRDLQNRYTIMNRLIMRVMSKDYAVSFQAGTLDIVALPGTDKEAVLDDIYPAPGDLGIAPIIIVAAIAAITLLAAGDQAADRMENEAKVEALRLQQKMIDTDAAMASKDPATKASYDKWKQQNAASFNKAMTQLSSSAQNQGWIERFLGSGPTSTLIIGALLIGGLLAWAKSRK